MRDVDRYPEDGEMDLELDLALQLDLAKDRAEKEALSCEVIEMLELRGVIVEDSSKGLPLPDQSMSTGRLPEPDWAKVAVAEMVVVITEAAWIYRVRKESMHIDVSEFDTVLTTKFVVRGHISHLEELTAVQKDAMVSVLDELVPLPLSNEQEARIAQHQNITGDPKSAAKLKSILGFFATGHSD